MVISVIGTGFVGVVTSGVFASLGHKVIGIDIDQEKIKSLNQGIIPFYEPLLTELIQEQLAAKTLLFTHAYEEFIPFSDLVIIAVGTPANVDGSANLEYVYAAVNRIAPLLKDKAIVALKSTVPPGTNQAVSDIIRKQVTTDFAVVSLPEFLREGSAVNDTLHPDRIVIGATQTWAIDSLTTLHSPLSENLVVVSPESAQLSKYAANNYLALRITYANQVADLCEDTGAHIGEVLTAIGQDHRIGSHYWYPGLGYGGSCFPKDVKELAATAKKFHQQQSLLITMDEYNEARIIDKMNQFDRALGGFKDKTVAVLGLSFKPNTTDMRVAPSLSVIPYLKDHKAIIKAYDPQTMPAAKAVWPKLFYGNNLEETLQGADVVLLLVEWEEFTRLNIADITHLLRPKAWIIDTRNVYDKNSIIDAGFNYLGIGNP